MSHTSQITSLACLKRKLEFLHAILKNDIGEVERFLDQGCDVDVRIFSGQYEKPAICFCIQSRYFDMAKLFVDRGCSLSLTTGFGMTPLHLAVLHGPEEFVQYLIKNRANVNTQHTSLQSPLHVACDNIISGAVAIVKRLCEANTRIDVVDIDGRTPLMLACINGMIDVALYLITKGAMVNIVDVHGYSALMYAISRFHALPVLVDALLENGAQVFDENLHDHDLLAIFLKTVVSHQGKCMENEKDRVHILKSLINAGCDVNRCDAHGQNALHIAATAKQAQIVKTVLNAGCTVSVVDNLGNTALFYACHSGDEASVTLILQAGVDKGLETKWLLKERQTPICNAKLVRICIAEFARLLSLSEICRLVMRVALAPNIEERVMSLEIPELLKEFIIFDY